MTPTVPQLEALAEKYRVLCTLRGARDVAGNDQQPHEAVVLRPRLRALSQQFPGCLRELDTLGASELARRAQAAAGAAAGGAVEPWMSWITAYHALMRAALALKRQAAAPRSRRAAATGVTGLAQQLSAATGLPLDARFVEAVTHPPQGRLAIPVLQALAAHFAVPAAQIAATLFPARGTRPYAL